MTGRVDRTGMTARAIRVRNACVHGLAYHYGVRAPTHEELAGVSASASLSDVWTSWRSVHLGEDVPHRRRRRVLLRIVIVTALVALALAASPAPLGALP